MYKSDLSAIGPVDLLLVTHAHVDHIGDAPALAKMNSTKLYGPADMITPSLLWALCLQISVIALIRLAA